MASIVDVRILIPRERRPAIYRNFKALKPGEGFELVDDYDPKFLYHQFRLDIGPRFDWKYLEQGPEVWRVRIGRTAAG